MRRSLWILTAPVVAGGLAWSASAINHQGAAVAGPPQTQNGKVVFFSRNGKPVPASRVAAPPADDSASEAAADAAEAAADEPEDTREQPVAPQRYVRNRSAQPTKSPAAGVKNYSELFTDSEEASVAEAAKPAPSAPAARRTARPGSAVAARQPAAPQRKPAAAPVAPEAPADASESADDASAAPTQLVEGTREKADVRQAELRARADAPKAAVRPVQHSTKPTSSNPGRAPAAPTDDDELSAPAPAPAARAAAPAKARPATVKTAAAVAAPAPQPARSVRKTTPFAPSKSVVSQVSGEAASSAAPASGVTLAASAGASEDVPMVSLRWAKIDEVNVNQECKVGLLVKNTGKLPAKDIVVEAFFPRTVRLVDAEPVPNDSKDHLVWIFEHLDPAQEKTIEITMIPSRRGELATNATVRFTGVASSVVRVEEPQLGLAISGSREAAVGETLTQVITVSNPGTGVAHDVVVHANVPEGLEHPRGKVVEMGIGSLGPGESRELKLPLTAVTGGEGDLLVEARGSSNLSQNAQVTIQVVAPKLNLEVTGPGLRYIGRNAVYVATITNEGAAATDNVRIVHLVPEGFEFKRADKGGKYDAATGSVSWFLGRVESNESVQVACELAARQSGEYLHMVQVSAEGGTSASAKTSTRIESSSKVTMEVADLDDPVEVGAETAYEIRIRNDGSRAAQDLKLVCELPAGVELVDTAGPTTHTVDKGQVVFQPIAELAAGARTSFTVRVNGKVAGNLRMRARLVSSASPEPVIVEEVTKFYAD